MSGPKRYSVMHDGAFSPDGLVEYEHGPLVSFSDYDALRCELAEARKLLALTYAAAHPSEGMLYGDDGELQFGGFPDPIDFVRDSVAEIRSKIDARGMRRLAAAMAETKEVPR
jgi:hypothetical protein